VVVVDHERNLAPVRDRSGVTDVGGAGSGAGAQVRVPVGRWHAGGVSWGEREPGVGLAIEPDAPRSVSPDERNRVIGLETAGFVSWHDTFRAIRVAALLFSLVARDARRRPRRRRRRRDGEAGRGETARRRPSTAGGVIRGGGWRGGTLRPRVSAARRRPRPRPSRVGCRVRWHPAARGA
jgi:hypothetical protein